jgi:hypothetical protein
MPHTMERAAYAQMFGPTVGDKVRLESSRPLSLPSRLSRLCRMAGLRSPAGSPL